MFIWTILKIFILYCPATAAIIVRNCDIKVVLNKCPWLFRGFFIFPTLFYPVDNLILADKPKYCCFHLGDKWRKLPLFGYYTGGRGFFPSKTFFNPIFCCSSSSDLSYKSNRVIWQGLKIVLAEIGFLKLF